MKVAKDTQSYLQKKLEGTRLLSPGSLYGISALSITTEDFAVIELEKDTYSLYVYKVKNGRFKIEEYKEQCSHNLFANFPVEILVDANAQKWLNCVFWDREGECLYDETYDSLRIAENSNMHFDEALCKLSLSLQDLRLNIHQHIVFLTGSFARNGMVRYVFQKELSTATFMKVLPLEICDLEMIKSENNYILLDEQQLNSISINVHGGLNVRFFINAPAIVNLPISMSKSEVAYGHYWEELYNNPTPDYRVGEYDFKYLSLHAECDALGGVYLEGKDMAENSKVIKL